MAESNATGAQADRALEVFGETVIIRGDLAGALVDAAMIEEIVPPTVGAPVHRHGREDEISCFTVRAIESDRTRRKFRKFFSELAGGPSLRQRGHCKESKRNLHPIQSTRFSSHLSALAVPLWRFLNLHN